MRGISSMLTEDGSSTPILYVLQGVFRLACTNQKGHHTSGNEGQGCRSNKGTFRKPINPHNQLLDPQRVNKHTHQFAKLTTCKHSYHMAFSVWSTISIPRTSCWVIICLGRPLVKLVGNSSKVRDLVRDPRGLYGKYRTARQVPARRENNPLKASDGHT